MNWGLKKINGISILSLALIVLLGSIYFYRESKQRVIVTFNIQEVFDGFDMQKELKEIHDNKLKSLSKSIDSLEASINQRMSQQGMTDEAYRASAQQLYTLQQERELYDSEGLDEADAKIQKQLVHYMKEYGKEKGCSALIAYNSDYPIVYADSTMDVTKDIILFVNLKYSGR
jgi:outer membrane protein